jgi:hypothetical protein
VNAPAGDGAALGAGFGGDVDHMGLALGVKMGEIAHSD